MVGGDGEEGQQHQREPVRGAAHRPRPPSSRLPWPAHDYGLLLPAPGGAIKKTFFAVAAGVAQAALSLSPLSTAHRSIPGADWSAEMLRGACHIHDMRAFGHLLMSISINLRAAVS